MGVDPDRAAIVEATLKARQSVSDARQRQKDRRIEALRKRLNEDPYRWPCAQCYVGNKDLYNFGEATKCYKCCRPKPSAEDCDYEHTRWKCTNCSTDEFTISGMFESCPDCGQEFDFSQDWWAIPDQRTEADPTLVMAPEDVGAGDQGKKPRKRGGKKHKKRAVSQPRVPCPEPAAGADERFRSHQESSSEEEVNYKRRRASLASKGRGLVPPLYFQEQ